MALDRPHRHCFDFSSCPLSSSLPCHHLTLILASPTPGGSFFSPLYHPLTIILASLTLSSRHPGHQTTGRRSRRSSEEGGLRDMNDSITWKKRERVRLDSAIAEYQCNS